jgi:hypothetical protein
MGQPPSPPSPHQLPSPTITMSAQSSFVKTERVATISSKQKAISTSSNQKKAAMLPQIRKKYFCIFVLNLLEKACLLYRNVLYSLSGQFRPVELQRG